jgi:hypothetical protein
VSARSGNGKSASRTLADQLRALERQAAGRRAADGLPYDRSLLAEGSGVSRKTLGAWLDGTRTPQQDDALMRVVSTLALWAAQDPPAERDWIELRSAARASRGRPPAGGAPAKKRHGRLAGMTKTKKVIGGVALACVVSVISAVVVSAASGGLRNLSSSCLVGSPFAVSVYHQSDLAAQGLGAMAFPGKLNLSPAEVSGLPGSVDGGSQGYDVTSTSADLTLTARCSVRILQMSADVVARHAPLSGTIVVLPSQGGEPDTAITFRLDSANPVGLNGQGAQPYFQDRTFVFAPHEQDTFKLEGWTAKSAIQWKVKITFLERGHVRSLLVQDGSRPFRVTAFATTGADPYQAEYFDCEDEFCSGSESGWFRIYPSPSAARLGVGTRYAR